MARTGVSPVRLIHTGQHYDEAMSGAFFSDLGMKAPDEHLGVGSGTQAEQTSRLLLALEASFQANRPDRVIVVGDVNSTLAAALAAAKLGIPVDHVEAGLRSWDRSMPEEINRLVTDGVSDLLFVSEPDGAKNLRREGHDRGRIHFVGNVMIDSLRAILPRARTRKAALALGLRRRGYAILTLHRPANVDDAAQLRRLIEGVAEAFAGLPIIFPVHPRTRPSLDQARLPPTLRAIAPLGYTDFISLLDGAMVAVTDSGGIQEETTWLGVPCLTLRSNTERPITVAAGTNTLVGDNLRSLSLAAGRIRKGTYKKGSRPELWDGRAADRIAAVYRRLRR